MCAHNNSWSKSQDHSQRPIFFGTHRKLGDICGTTAFRIYEWPWPLTMTFSACRKVDEAISSSFTSIWFYFFSRNLRNSLESYSNRKQRHRSSLRDNNNNSSKRKKRERFVPWLPRSNDNKCLDKRVDGFETFGVFDT